MQRGTIPMKVGDASLSLVSRRLAQRARERLTPLDSLYVAPAVAYLAAAVTYYFSYGKLLGFSPYLLLLAALPLVALLGSSRETMRPWIPVIAVFLAYEGLQGIAAYFAATRHLFSVYPLDRLIWGFNVTGWVQASFYSVTMTDITTFFYSLHIPLVVITAGALWYYNRKVFGKYITALALTSYLALVTFILIPTSPPWYQGVASDLFYGGTTSALPSGLLNFVSAFESDRFAAFPSLHAAYAVIFAYFVIKLDRRLAVVAVPVAGAILFSTLYLGQHYLLDLVAGVIYALIPCLIAERFSIKIPGADFKKQWHATRKKSVGAASQPARE
ncbi:MAG: phosphatase PAP2 family protein [Thaumarchaeota archaeon]|nr:phosphatase PAP2 family protein [Nitrososphaerota archaeon]